MPRICKLTGKKTMYGHNVPRKGLPKKKGGAGQHIGVKTRRAFKVNIIDKRFFIPALKKHITLKLSARALRTVSKIGLETFLTKNGMKIKDLI